MFSADLTRKIELALKNRTFVFRDFRGPAAGITAYTQILNPVGSGKTLALVSLQVALEAPAFLNFYSHATALAVNGSEWSTVIDGDAPTFEVHAENDPAGLPAAFGTFDVRLADTYYHVVDLPILIAAGKGLVWGPGTAALDMRSFGQVLEF